MTSKGEVKTVLITGVSNGSAAPSLTGVTGDRPCKSRPSANGLHPAAQDPQDPARYDRKLYKLRHRIENILGRLKDWWRVATRYDRCAHSFMSAIVIFWHGAMSPEPSA